MLFKFYLSIYAIRKNNNDTIIKEQTYTTLRNGKHKQYFKKVKAIMHNNPSITTYLSNQQYIAKIILMGTLFNIQGCAMFKYVFKKGSECMRASHNHIARKTLHKTKYVDHIRPIV